MNKIYTKARAKINLNLELLGKREDGYHNIESVFQKVNLYDEIYIKKVNTNDCEIQTNIEELNNKQNIIYKAYLKLKEKYPEITGINVKINKKIPMQAGLGGGSTDCASFILAMNKLFNLNLSKEEIENIGKNLGADVVPCLYNRAIKAEGIGEIITEINTKFKYYLLIIKPDISCNTKEMYKKLDDKKDLLLINSKTKKIISALEKNNLDLLCDNIYNVFEEVVTNNSVIQKVNKELIISGAKASMMSGSGSSVFGIFDNKEKAKLAYKSLKEKYKIFICTSYNI